MSSSELRATTEHVQSSRLLPPDAHTHPVHSHRLSQSDGCTPLSISWAAGGGALLCKQRGDAAALISALTSISCSYALELYRLMTVRNRRTSWSDPVHSGSAPSSPAGGPVSQAERCRRTRETLARSVHSHGVSSSIRPHVTSDPGALTGSSEDVQNKSLRVYSTCDNQRKHRAPHPCRHLD